VIFETMVRKIIKKIIPKKIVRSVGRGRSYLFRKKCINLENPKKVYDEGSWVQRGATKDQIRIKRFLREVVSKKTVLLHVGVGDSSIAKGISDNVKKIDGLTVVEQEKEYAESLQIPNYQVQVLNKYSKQILDLSNNYDYIIDNNFSSYACCKYHFSKMFENYLALLSQDGVIITDIDGLAHFTSGYGMSYKDLQKLEKKCPIRVAMATEHLIVIAKKIIAEKKSLKTAYLTIDDSPSKHMKHKVDYLKKNSVPAVFFCRGDLLEKYQEQALYAIKEGFVLGNHAYSHVPFSKLSQKECLSEILRTDILIENLYKEANIQQPIKLFRYPMGDKGFPKKSVKNVMRTFYKKFNRMDNYLTNLGYVSLKNVNIKKRTPHFLMMNDVDLYWSFDIGEWRIWKENRKLKDIIDRINKHLSYKEGNEIILMHDQNETQEYFEEIIEKLISKGFQFKEVQ
jgi:peptidoglycan-N-acetylglucosamine deacetylase